MTTDHHGMQRKVEESYVRGNKEVSGSGGVFSSNPKTVLDCLRHWSIHAPERDAFVFRSTTEPRLAISWKELYERSYKMAMVYTELGIKQGEVIAVVSRKCPEWLYAVFGAMAAGIIVTTIVFTYADGSDVIVMMKKLRTCSLLVLDPGLNESNWSILKGLLDTYDNKGHVSSTKMPYLRNLMFILAPIDHIRVQSKTVAGLLAEKRNVELSEVDPDSIAILFQTSGSTGVPKIVAHSQTGILKLGLGVPAYNAGPIEFNDRPFRWIGGFPFGFLFGQTRVTVLGTTAMPEDPLSFIIDVIQTERCTCTYMLPPLIFELTKRHNILPPNWPMETISTAGQPITKSLAACIGKICKRLSVIYGATELSIITEMAFENMDDFEDYSCGLPENGIEMKITDRTGTIVPVGERGEVNVRCDWTFIEYFNDPEKTATVKSSDGWYKTDDYGWMNADGFLFVEGRVSDMIICGGVNVAPAILESVLMCYPAVESAFIVPVPHDELYQVICACVTLRSGFTVTEAQLRKYVERQHNDNEALFTVLPKYYFILEQLPEGSTGKISRKTLKQMAMERVSEKREPGE